MTAGVKKIMVMRKASPTTGSTSPESDKKANRNNDAAQNPKTEEQVYGYPGTSEETSALLQQIHKGWTDWNTDTEGKDKKGKTPFGRMQIFLAGLEKAFQHELALPNLPTAQLNKYLNEVSSHFVIKDDLNKITSDQPVTFHGVSHKPGEQAGVYEATPDTIICKNKKFTQTHANDIIRLAAFDHSMLTQGITLTGSEEERTLLANAIHEHNKTAPKGQKLTINVGLPEGYTLDLAAEQEEPTETVIPTQKETPAPRKENVETIESVLSDDHYNFVKEAVISSRTATQKVLGEFIKQSGYTGHLGKAKKEATTRLDDEGVTKLNDAGNRRNVIPTADFAQAATANGSYGDMLTARTQKIISEMQESGAKRLRELSNWMTELRAGRRSNNSAPQVP